MKRLLITALSKTQEMPHTLESREKFSFPYSRTCVLSFGKLFLFLFIQVGVLKTPMDWLSQGRDRLCSGVKWLRETIEWSLECCLCALPPDDGATLHSGKERHTSPLILRNTTKSWRTSNFSFLKRCLNLSRRSWIKIEGYVSWKTIRAYFMILLDFAC